MGYVRYQLLIETNQLGYYNYEIIRIFGAESLSVIDCLVGDLQPTRLCPELCGGARDWWKVQERVEIGEVIEYFILS